MALARYFAKYNLDCFSGTEFAGTSINLPASLANPAEILAAQPQKVTGLLI